MSGAAPDSPGQRGCRPTGARRSWQSSSRRRLPGPQPSHIRRGTCKDPSLEPAFGLSNVERRKSETTIDASLEELSSEGSFHVDVSKSVAEIETVVACGEIPEPTPTGGGYGGGY